MNLMFGNSIPMGAKSLEFLWAKQSVISNNLANVDTPHYKSKYVTFEENFRNHLKMAKAAGNAEQTRSIIDSSSYTVNETVDTSARIDENNVNADAEEVEMARTIIQYQAMLQAVNSDFTRLRTVIKGQ